MNKEILQTQTTTIEIPDSEPTDDFQKTNNKDNCVTVDDDSDVVLDDNNTVIDIDSDDLEIIEPTVNETPIIIDDDDPNCVINPLNVIKNKQDYLWQLVCQENHHLAEFIEEAINLDSTGSMKRIIQRTLIPLYLNCHTSYKKSEVFKNTLKKTAILLETSPHLKYSHVRNLCDSLKYTKVKLKPPIPVKSPESKTKKRKHKEKNHSKHKKRKKNDTPIVNTTKQKKKLHKKRRKNNNTNINTNKRTMIEIEVPPISSTSNKENIITENEAQSTVDTTNISQNNKNTESVPNNLLTTHYVVHAQTVPSETTLQPVESLENKIAVLKMKLERVEQQEVNGDHMSPYIIADGIKIEIVKLYKQLCDLMGAEPTKRHEVKLQTMNGHPPGPARCLQEYINENIDEFGNPPFPDIFEVVKCVKRAVEEDRLNWNKKKIVAEAQALLKHYGQAIQKRRKKREWRDMVSLCKEELVDPADLDPVLEAKLQENSRIAKRNEDEILDKYVRLEKDNITKPTFELSVENGEDDTESESEEQPRPRRITPFLVRNIQAPADSTTEIENIDSNKNLPVVVNIQSNSSITSPNIQSASNVKTVNILNIRPQCGSNVINTSTVGSIVQNVPSVINTTSLCTNIQAPILVFNSPNNTIPYLHGSICYINTTPALATGIETCSSILNSTNIVGNLQSPTSFVNSPNNMSTHLEGSQQSATTHLVGNLQSGTSHLQDNLQIMPNNLVGDLQSVPTQGNLQNMPNNLVGDLQSVPINLQNTQNVSNILNSNTESNSKDIEENLQCHIIPKNKEINTVNIGNVEYKRTILMDSNESDFENEITEEPKLETFTNIVKERDKDQEVIEHKIKIKQEEDDVIKLLNELDSDCVGTIFDIEDPFLVIEISDSSDEEQ